MNAYMKSMIRTTVPLLVGFVASWAARKGFDIKEAEVAAWLTPTISGAYYAAVRKAEQKWPTVGWLIGLANQPVYDATKEVEVREVEKVRYIMRNPPSKPAAPTKKAAPRKKG